MRKIHIERFSAWSVVAAAVLSVVFVFISVYGIKDFKVLENATEEYFVCENAANRLQKGSDILTEQVRLYVMTGSAKYMDGYFTEADVDKNRETAVDELSEYFSGTQMLADLKAGLDDSRSLMESEIYAMRLAAEAFGADDGTLPARVASTVLSPADAALTPSQKLEAARVMVSDETYESAKSAITEKVASCLSDLAGTTRNRQGRASSIFKDLYVKQELGLVLLIILLILDSVVIRKYIVHPLRRFNECIEREEIFPITGAAELCSLAETYNRVFEENEETQRLIRHEAEHDALTDLLNRGSFNKLLELYEKGSTPFALIIGDVDQFKTFNDSYGHAVGDAVLKKVSDRLRRSFRSSDYMFRIGGDEFAVIMIDVSESLKPTVAEKLSLLRESLADTSDGLPKITMSIGVAFSESGSPAGSIFKKADSALYCVKEHGRNSSCFFGDGI